ncbi:MFS transporter [Devosia limi DSM 17137]|uniref:MFS transporter n=2 Tax=Devosia TaxID=46913 RepID=A0A0F5LPY3_9HYPH|nr:MFS transporter [Devosia limi DSM 17137]SHF61899.1 Sugar phosphate permease [Devosia limi DSM 17137]
MIGVAAMAIAYVLSQFFRSFMAVLTPDLVADLGASTAELSLASGAWFASFAVMQFVVGISLDRYGPRRTAAFMFGVLGGGGAFLFAAASGPWMIIAAMALIGAGCAPVLMAGMFIFARSFPPARLAMLTSWFIAFGSAGNVAGTTPLAMAAEGFGWRAVLVVIGMLAVLTAVALLVLVRDPARADPGPGQGSAFAGYLDVLRNRKLWPIFPLVGLHYAAMIGILGLWAGPYLSEVYGADSLAIGQTTLFMALAAIAGSFIYGPLDTLFGTRKWVAVLGNIGSVLALTWLALFPAQGMTQALIAFMLVALLGANFALIMAHARAFVPVHLTGRGITLLNFFSIGAVGLMQFLTGIVVTAVNVPGNPEAAYAALFACYAIGLAVAVLIYLRAEDAPPEVLRRSRNEVLIERQTIKSMDPNH